MASNDDPPETSILILMGLTCWKAFPFKITFLCELGLVG